MFVKKTMGMNVYANGADQYGNRFGGNSFSDSLNVKELGLEKWKPSEGENIVDFIPFNATEVNPLVIAGKAEVGDPMYSLEYFVHRGIGPSNRNITCLNQYGHKCPLCEEAKRIKSLGGAENEEASKAMSAKRRIVYVVHDIKNNKYGYWDTGWKSVEEKIQKLARVTIDPNTNSPVNVFDWQDGMSVKFYGEKKKFAGHDFIEVDVFSFVPRKPLSDEVLEHSVDLATVIQKTSAEEMEKIISGDLSGTAAAPKTAQAAPQQTNTFDALAKANIEETPTQAAPQQTPTTSSQTPESVTYDDMESVQTQAAPAQEQPVVAESPETTCPHGHKWGDADKHPECGKCPVWERCLG